jgi:antirestriction protein ArdC
MSTQTTTTLGSSQVSTGGGNGHVVGCTCPFCLSNATTAEVDIDLSAPAPVVDEPVRAFVDAPEAFTAKYESVDDKVKAFKEEIDRAVEDLAYDENWLGYLDMMSKFHRYSPTNQLLIAVQSGGRATRVAGFRAWQDKFGRTVNKGEKAIAIFAPKMAWVAKKDPNTGEPVKDAKGKPVKHKVMVGVTTASVFDVAQTSGDPLPEIDQELSVEPPEGFLADMEAAAKEAGYTVEYRKMDSHASGTAQGWTNPKSKEIVVDASLTPGSQAATLAHELGHVYAGHCEPENDGKYHVGDGGCRGRFEVEADSIAYTIQRANGVQPGQATKLTAQYVAGWSRHDKDALKDSADAVSKATKKILEAVPFRNVKD